MHVTQRLHWEAGSGSIARLVATVRAMLAPSSGPAWRPVPLALPAGRRRGVTARR